MHFTVSRAPPKSFLRGSNFILVLKTPNAILDFYSHALAYDNLNGKHRQIQFQVTLTAKVCARYLPCV